MVGANLINKCRFLTEYTEMAALTEHTGNVAFTDSFLLDWR